MKELLKINCIIISACVCQLTTIPWKYLCSGEKLAGVNLLIILAHVPRECTSGLQQRSESP